MKKSGKGFILMYNKQFPASAARKRGGRMTFYRVETEKSQSVRLFPPTS